MPLYEYHCKPCDMTFELLIKSDGEQAHCPQCDNIDLHKQFSVPAAAQTAGSRLGVLPQNREATSSAPFGCGRPQCGSGMCAGLE